MVSIRFLEDRAVQVRVDSRSTVKYVRDRGGQSEVMNFLTKILWGWCILCLLYTSDAADE